MFLNVKNQVSASSHLKILHWDLCYCRRGVERGWRDRHTGAGRAALTHGELTEAGGSSRFLLAVCWHKGLSVCPALLCLSPDHKTMALLCSCLFFKSSVFFRSAPEPGIPGCREGTHGVWTHREGSRRHPGGQVGSHTGRAIGQAPAKVWGHDGQAL